MSSAFTFQRQTESFVMQRQSRASASLFFEDFDVFRPRLSQSSLPPRLSSLLAYEDHQGHMLFTFQRLQCLFPRLSQSSLHFQDYQSLVSCRDNQGHMLL